MLGGGGAYFLHGWGLVSLVVKTSHRDSVDAAGGDGLEGREGLRCDVEGETVHGDPFFDADAEGSDLAVLDPHAGEALLASGDDVVVGEGEDQRFF